MYAGRQDRMATDIHGAMIYVGLVGALASIVVALSVSATAGKILALVGCIAFIAMLVWLVVTERISGQLIYKAVGWVLKKLPA